MKAKENAVPRILVLYYSAFGRTEALARAVAEGARQVDGVEVHVKRVPELVPEHLARQSGYLLDQRAPVADTEELAFYDAVLFGAPTRFGSMAAQMRSFLDRTGALWSKGRLMGKIGSIFTTNGPASAAQDSTVQSFHGTLLHHGMLIAGLPGRGPTDDEIERARYQGRHVATLAKRIAA